MTRGESKVAGHSRRAAIGGIGAALTAVSLTGPLTWPLTAWARDDAAATGATLSDEVFFAGLAYLAEHEDIPKVLPFTVQQISSGGGTGFDRVLAQLAAQTKCEVRINTDGLGKLAPGRTAYVMALAIDHEVTNIEETRDGYKLSCELWGQILVFDFHARSIVSSVPLIARYNDLLPDRPTPDNIADSYHKLLFSDDPGCVQGQFAAKLSGRIMPQTASRSIRVTHATLSDMAAKQVDDLKMNASGKFAEQMASSFTGWLTANQRICVLPPSASEAIGNTMAARLSNGTVYQLTIPKPDYEVSLRLDGFKKVMTTEVVAGRGYVYGAFVTIEVTEPLSRTVFFSQQVRHGENRTQPATAGDIDDAAVYDAVLPVLFSQFTTAIDPLDESWATHNILPANSAVAALKSLRGIIKLCR